MELDGIFLCFFAKGIKSLSKSNFFVSPHIPLQAIGAEFCKIIKNAEDAYRESVGLPKVGEGWISETKLFNKVRDNYNHYQDAIDILPIKEVSDQYLSLFRQIQKIDLCQLEI